MKKKAIIIIVVLLIATAGVATFILINARNEPSNDAILQKFDCNRITEDYRSTDIYCNDPGLYRQHLKGSHENSKHYKDCVKNSISEEEAQTRNYTGNIRDDSVTPKMCQSTSGAIYLEPAI